MVATMTNRSSDDRRVPHQHDDTGRPLATRELLINIGPHHPAMHGTLRWFMKLDGETIVEGIPEIGFLHRAFEKESEGCKYNQVIVYTDRLNYLSAMCNNVGYCKTIEKLMGLTITPRCTLIRVLLCELSRIIEHLVTIGTNVLDLGGMTNFWWTYNLREEVYKIFEKLSGARLTYAYTRIGGLAYDLYDGFEGEVKAVLRRVYEELKDVKGLIGKNRIFLERTQGVTPISAEDALSYGFTGPCLRASGVDHDLRKAAPYYGYDEFDFDIPVGEVGDTYDRIMIRFEEIDQSMRIVHQALLKLKQLGPGPVNVDDRGVTLPKKNQVYGSIEGLMNHFMLIINDMKPPAGEIYDATESPNGELGFFIVSDGGISPYRVRCRAPCFHIYSAAPQMVRGAMLADVVATIGSLNVIAGELDR